MRIIEGPITRAPLVPEGEGLLEQDENCDGGNPQQVHDPV